MKTAFAFVNLFIAVWLIYLTLAVADYINAWPFNGGWPF